MVHNAKQWSYIGALSSASSLLSGLLQCTVLDCCDAVQQWQYQHQLTCESHHHQIRSVWGITCGLACVQSLTTAHSWLLLWAVAMLLEGVGPLRCQRRRCCGAPSPGARGKSGWASACRCWRAQLLHELWLVLRVSYGPACMSVCVQQHSCVWCVCVKLGGAHSTQMPLTPENRVADWCSTPTWGRGRDGMGRSSGGM